MLKKISGTLLRRKKPKTFRAWQIELTTDCPLCCRMCARDGEAAWQRLQMPLENFRMILPPLAEVETVILEGWGESLLHPDLVEIVRLVKEAGPEVGFVTSGLGLKRQRIRELIEAGVDFMGFSVAGTTPATHDAIRIHSHLPDLLETIRLVGEEKALLGRRRPRLHMVYLMLKENIAEVPLLPALAAGVGVEEVFLINSCHIATPWQESQRVFAREGEAKACEALISQARENAEGLGIRLKASALCLGESAVCSENPLQNLYISADGEVAPCVYAHPPLPAPFRRRFCGEEVLVGKVSFGNIFREPFERIWESVEYRAFRDRFADRERAYRAFFRTLFDGSGKGLQKDFSLPAPPGPCQSCHKIRGVY